MKLVSENSEAEVAKQRALDDLRWPLLELAANLVRVVRGAGRAYELLPQMAKVIERAEDYRSVVGYYPSDYEISEILSVRYWDLPHEDDMSRAVGKIVQGALQSAASTLVNQSTQQAAGDSEIFEGIRWVEEVRAADRARHTESFTDRQAREKAEAEMDLRAEMLGRAKMIAKRKPKGSK